MDPLLQKTPSNDLSQPTAPDPNFLDYYRILRGQIEHEDNLVGSRISWFVTSQSFLFSAYAIIASGITSAATQATLDAKHVLLVIIPLVAIAVSALMWLAIFAGFAAMRLIRDRYHRLVSHGNDQLLPPIHGMGIIRRAGQAAPALLPPIFMAVWIFLLMRRLF